jgi:MFS family permease
MIPRLSMLAGVARRTVGRVRSMPQLVLAVGLVVFVDTMLYAVLTPLLPGLAHELRLSKLSAGVLTASYAGGTLLGALPGGLLVVRAGPRFAVCSGLSLLSASLVAFGLLDSAPALDAARFIEGLGGACSWSGGIAWIVAETPAAQRATRLGQAVGAAVGGALLGPAVGTVASAIGRPAAFSAMALIAAALVVWASRLPGARLRSEQGLGDLVASLRRPAISIGMWFVTLPAAASGVVNVLAPLRFHRLGGGAAAIGAAFLVAAGLEAAMAPLVGVVADRRGRLVPLAFGLAAATVTVALLPVPDRVVLLAGVVVLISLALGWFWAPSMALLTDAAAGHGLDQGLAAALINIAWAGGQILGSAGGGALAKGTGDWPPTAIMSGLCALTLAALVLSPRLRRSLTRRGTAPEALVGGGIP